MVVRQSAKADSTEARIWRLVGFNRRRKKQI
jgi:hypothetical protein